MRYYDFTLSTDTEYIRENAKINLRDYAYKNPVEAMNKYMQQNLINDLCFFAFREEEGIVPAAFSYNEKKKSFKEAFDCVAEMLRDVFTIIRIKSDPAEITMFDFLEHILEASRRELIGSMARIADSTDLWIYYYSDRYQMGKESSGIRYVFKERIISENDNSCDLIYDKDFRNELSNIASHVCYSDHVVNPVHYVISARSMEATEDMTEILMQKLYQAGRITGRRMEIISDIEPELFSTNNNLVTTIENNYGGVIVFDLTGKFGYDPTEFTMTARYLVNLLKKYRNHCLFVFTYNMDNPGFSYQVLPLLSKYIIPVKLREGSVNRRGAVSYLKYLIGRSEYAGYSEQANEFMEMYPGSVFSQTDVLNAYG